MDQDIATPGETGTVFVTGAGKGIGRAIVERSRRWLSDAGVVVADNVDVEIDPMLALDAQQLSELSARPTRIDADTYLRP